MIRVSRSIYIRSQKKYKEYVDFFNVWRNAVVPEFRSRLNDTFEKTAVSEGFKDIVLDQTEDFLNKTLVFEDYYEERLGQIASNGFIFDHLYFDGMSIWDKQSLKEFLEKHSDYVLIDEYDNVVSFEEIFKK